MMCMSTPPLHRTRCYVLTHYHSQYIREHILCYTITPLVSPDGDTYVCVFPLICLPRYHYIP